MLTPLFPSRKEEKQSKNLQDKEIIGIQNYNNGNTYCFLIRENFRKRATLMSNCEIVSFKGFETWTYIFTSICSIFL